ncbi:unnamed protein product [Protopolystoma xenopodis]|uniref:Uncharacterized protein n=1 Tax=Protopolystoma xenopodis TaxID=117903 RepID=A0A448WW66_9PLAT|nr:unnamed protein product [Protopolystoma xenopodis]
MCSCCFVVERVLRLRTLQCGLFRSFLRPQLYPPVHRGPLDLAMVQIQGSQDRGTCGCCDFHLKRAMTTQAEADLLKVMMILRWAVLVQRESRASINQQLKGKVPS